MMQVLRDAERMGAEEVIYEETLARCRYLGQQIAVEAIRGAATGVLFSSALENYILKSDRQYEWLIGAGAIVGAIYGAVQAIGRNA
jgi:hypothetical protein